MVRNESWKELRMRRAGIALSCFLALGVAAWADGTRYVYEIRALGSAGTDPWSMNMAVAAEAARAYAPVSFKRTGTAVSFAMDTELSLSLGPESELERSAERVLVRRAVTIRGERVLPKARKKARIRFSLSDLMAEDGKAARSPLEYALAKAVEASRYASGRAWVISAEYDGAGRFLVVVALTDR